MSHLKERKEKNCLNCNAAVSGRYCHICGQENIEPKESAWHLVSHFFQDITHFDGKLFSTLKLLLLKPGFLSQQYVAGRRASYLNPIRMYVFTSAIFFLVFFSFFHKEKSDVKNLVKVNGKSIAEVDTMSRQGFDRFTAGINKSDHKDSVPMTRSEFRNYYDTAKVNGGIEINGRKYHSTKEYDSLLANRIVVHNWFVQKLIYRLIGLNEQYHGNVKEFTAGFINTLVHSFPQMLFLSLPLMALLLKFIYLRRNQFYYVSHGIFSIHLYIFVFIAMLCFIGLSKLQGRLNWAIFDVIGFLLTAGIFFYEYKAMRNFYQQKRGKTILKFLLINILSLIVMSSLFMIFLFLSLFKL